MFLIKSIFTVIFYYLAFIFSIILINVFTDSFEYLNLYYGFMIGIAVFVVISFIKIKKRKYDFNFLRTFSHETTHMIFLILFFKSPSEFRASDDNGGHIKHNGKSNFLISLSPYCIPIFTIPLLLIYPAIISKYWWYLDMAVGLTYAFHISTFIKQMHIKQPDIKDSGIVFSYGFIALMNFYFAGAILLSMKYGGLKSFWLFIERSYDKILVMF